MERPHPIDVSCNQLLQSQHQPIVASGHVQGVRGMKVNGQRKLLVPPELVSAAPCLFWSWSCTDRKPVPI